MECQQIYVYILRPQQGKHVPRHMLETLVCWEWYELSVAILTYKRRKGDTNIIRCGWGLARNCVWRWMFPTGSCLSVFRWWVCLGEIKGLSKGKSLLEEVVNLKQALRFYNFSPLPVPLLCFLCVGEMWSADPMHILLYAVPTTMGSTFWKQWVKYTLFPKRGFFLVQGLWHFRLTRQPLCPQISQARRGKTWIWIVSCT